ncbi:hypothetical protein MNEG_5400 [Monoraphidium neglectum]|uniref:Glycoside-hydrolase family GH114 TIM-barrel domain-containing protein n=1 Tax=Monoraphidium neglectum TaxID=145388 RepID=A0A0D2L6K5_9CHLO|nr:hypothetical protein MNEG_5400 [Monoraphidium neglectum]KIZ02559.1 hypothetical protein MNEG_5400 [Monoraphidium neglectum]|eukprot:XP_013901578.1 hypothetical protein MNEG_5400 [Monoraphidium neglectum]
MTVALWATAAALVAVSLQGQVTAQVVDAAATTWWRPRLGYKFQYQLKMAFDVKRDFIPGVQARQRGASTWPGRRGAEIGREPPPPAEWVYLIDGFEATNADVAVILSKGFFPICYFSAGSYEDWRPDKGLFQASDYGSKLSGWAGEFWLDVRSANVKVIMTARMKMCKAKGFVGIDPDNVDAFANPSGFPLTAADQLAYNKWLAATAHGLGLAVGLKNDVGQIQDLVGDFDYFVNE